MARRAGSCGLAQTESPQQPLEFSRYVQVASETRRGKGVFLYLFSAGKSISLTFPTLK